MTHLDKYRAILRDIERLLEERAARYFVTRYQTPESTDLKLQCDTITVLLKQYLEPHIAWFEAQEDTALWTNTHLHTIQVPSDEVVLTIDLEPEGESDAHD